MVVALCARNLCAVDDGSNCLGDVLMLIISLINEPGRSFFFGCLGPRLDDVPHKSVPRPILPNHFFQKCIRAVVPPLLFPATAVAPHQQHVPYLPKGSRIIITCQKLINEPGTLLWLGIAEKSFGLLPRWDTTAKIEIHPPDVGLIIAKRCGPNPTALPIGCQQQVNRRGWLSWNFACIHPPTRRLCSGGGAAFQSGNPRA